jgi:hypothetical protein
LPYTERARTIRACPSKNIKNNNKNKGNNLKRTYLKGDSGAWIEGTGFVRRLLTDDNDGDRHQRIILDIKKGQTMLIAHNIDIALRVPVGIGDRIQFRGMYEWNELGGLVHWTHHDPHGVEEGGYVRYRTVTYD